MNFINANVLLWLPVIVPAMLLIYWWGTVRRRKLLFSILGKRADDPQHVSVNYPRRHIRFAMLCLSVIFLIFAAARPWWGMNIVPYEAKGRDLMVLFDVSKSMLAQDIKPSRLEHAKWLLRELISEPTGDRYGLVAFAGEAFLECPLTRDMSGFSQYLDELNTDSIPLPGTNLQRALGAALEAFKSAEGGHRAVILITDGEELEGDSSKVINQLKEKKIPLFIVGMGDPAVPALIPNGDGKSGFKRDPKGELVKTQLNEKLLRELRAAVPGSLYVRSTMTEPGIDVLKAKISSLTPEKLENSTGTRPVERFQYFIGGALALLLIWMALSERLVTAKLPAKLAVLFILLSASISNGSEQPEMLAPAADAKQERDEKIIAAPVPEIEEAPKDPIVLYNLGREAQIGGQEEVEKWYEQAINSKDSTPQVRQRAFHNLGVLKHEKAREAIKKADSMQEQNLSAAEKEYQNAGKLMEQAEEFYLKAVEDDGSVEANDFATNQQVLLNNRQTVDEVTKDIKEFKNIQPEAIKKLEASIEQLKKESSVSSKLSQDAIDKVKTSYEKVQRLNKLSKKLRQRKMEEKSSEAAKFVKDAMDAESPQKAQEFLAQALELLKQKEQDNQDKQNQDKQDQDKQDQDKQDQDKQDQDKQDQDKQDQDKQDQDKQNQDKQNQDKQDQDKQDQDQPLPEEDKKEQMGNGEKQQAPEIDPEQARRLLEQMARDERKLRDALKKQRQKEIRDIKIEKDW